MCQDLLRYLQWGRRSYTLDLVYEVLSNMHKDRGFLSRHKVPSCS